MHLSHISFDILTFRKLFVRCDHRHNSSETRTICPNIHRQCRFDTNTFRTSLNESSSHILHFSSHAVAATAAFTTFPPLLVLFSFSFSFFIRFVYKFEHELFIWIAKKNENPQTKWREWTTTKTTTTKKKRRKWTWRESFRWKTMWSIINGERQEGNIFFVVKHFYNIFFQFFFAAFQYVCLCLELQQNKELLVTFQRKTWAPEWNKSNEENCKRAQS